MISGPYFLKNGEYDLVNIDLIGYDPLTGKTSEECHQEWRHQLDEVQKAIDAAKWYHLTTKIKIRLKLMYLTTKQGLPY